MAKKNKNGRIVDVGGRPPVDFDDLKKEQLTKLAKTCLPQAVIADIMGVSVPTLNAYLDRNPGVFLEYKKGRAEVKAAIAGKAVSQALAGDTTMLIFLCKTLLGMSEKIDITADVTVQPSILSKLTTEQLQVVEHMIRENEANVINPG